MAHYLHVRKSQKIYNNVIIIPPNSTLNMLWQDVYFQKQQNTASHECVFSRQHDTALRMLGICEDPNALRILF